MSRFEIEATPLEGLAVVKRLPRQDDRGFFSRFFCAQEFAEAGHPFDIAQINHTLTRRRGAIRGMHFQRPPHAEDKLVSCLRGELFDVAVDLRRASPTYLKWFGVRLSEHNFLSLLIPKGFAHGFQAVSDDCELIYLHSHKYAENSEGALNAHDPALSINWPEAATDMSQRDRSHPMIGPMFEGISL